jgi:FMN phosphatase YigB (HAD superfamily)
MDDIVFLFDVDNTLLDNDQIQHDLKSHLAETYGATARDRYWAIFEDLFAEVGYAHYFGALERFRAEAPHNPRLLLLSKWLIDYPFAQRLFPGALDAVDHVRKWGRVAVLSDGDAVFQPHKVDQSGVWRVFDGDVLIFIHKEKELDQVERLYPARRYVLIDDKLRILAAVKQAWGDRVVTVFPRQGHYAHDPEALRSYAPPDIAIERIADLAALDRGAFWP